MGLGRSLHVNDCLFFILGLLRLFRESRIRREAGPVLRALDQRQPDHLFLLLNRLASLLHILSLHLYANILAVSNRNGCVFGALEERRGKRKNRGHRDLHNDAAGADYCHLLPNNRDHLPPVPVRDLILLAEAGGVDPGGTAPNGTKYAD